MIIQSVLKKSRFRFICLIIIAILILSGGIYYATAGSIFTTFTADKLSKINQLNSQALAKAQEANSANPNNVSNAVILPMQSDPGEKIHRLPPDLGWGISWLSTGPYKVSELWVVGDKPDYDTKSWNSAYAFSGNFKDNTNQGVIGTFVLNGASDKNWSGEWKTPGLWGSVTITNVVGDIISFNTENGVTGTFNFDTHVWTSTALTAPVTTSKITYSADGTPN